MLPNAPGRDGHAIVEAAVAPESATLPLDPIDLYIPSAHDCVYLIELSGANVGRIHRLMLHNNVIGRGSEATIRIDDDRVRSMHTRITTETGGAIFVHDMHGCAGIRVNGRRCHQHRLSDGDRLQVGGTTLLVFRFVDFLDESFRQRRYERATRDRMTGLSTPTYLRSCLIREIAYARRHRKALSVLIVRLDGLETIRERDGSGTAGQVVTAVARVLRQATRQEDVVARTAEGEFAVLCPGTSETEIRTLSGRLCDRILTTDLGGTVTTDDLRCSTGVAGLSDVSDPDGLDMLSAARARLQAA